MVSEYLFVQINQSITVTFGVQLYSHPAAYQGQRNQSTSLHGTSVSPPGSPTGITVISYWILRYLVNLAVHTSIVWVEVKFLSTDVLLSDLRMEFVWEFCENRRLGLGAGAFFC